MASATFKDLNGKDWTIQLDSILIELVRNELTDEEGKSLDISAQDGGGLVRICRDGVLLTRCLWLLVKDSAEGAKSTPQDFARAISSGEVQEAAEQALRNAVLGFTKPKLRQTLASVLEGQDRLTEMQMKEVEAQVADPKIREMLVDATRKGMLSQVDRIAMWLSSRKGSPDTAESVPEA